MTEAVRIRADGQVQMPYRLMAAEVAQLVALLNEQPVILGGLTLDGARGLMAGLAEYAERAEAAAIRLTLGDDASGEYAREQYLEACRRGRKAWGKAETANGANGANGGREAEGKRG